MLLEHLMKYRADIDGLRAIAVLAVIFYHAHLGFPGGYVGVDVFFVISGYLITAILLKNISNGTFSYADFWKRRVRRLVPALFAMTITTALVSYFLLLPVHLIDLSGALIAQPLLSSNVYFWRVVQAGYFGDPPEIRPLLHTWSLGVEEQFYLFFPLILILLGKVTRSRQKLAFILTFVATLSLALSITLTPTKAVAAFFNLPTRAWELLLGGMLNFLPCPPRALREALCWVGLSLVVYSCFFFTEDTPFPGWMAVVPTLGTFALLWGNSDTSTTTSISRVLSCGPMRLIGLTSYSSYLWHWPMVAFGDYVGLLNSIAARVSIVALSLVAGYLSWRFLENPFRDHPRLRSGRSVVLLFAAYAFSCWTIAGVYLWSSGFPHNWPKNTLSVHETKMDFRSCIWEMNPLTRNLRSKELGDVKRNQVDFLLWGDSHAMSVAPLLDTLGREYGLKGLMLTRSATPPLFSQRTTSRWALSPEGWRGWENAITQAVRDHHIPSVFLHSHWSNYLDSTFKTNAERTVERIADLGAKTYWITSVKEVKGSLQSSPYRAEPLHARWPVLNRLTEKTRVESEEEYRSRNRRAIDLLEDLQNNPKIEVLRPEQFQKDWTTLNPEGLPSYKDAGHLTDFGALRLRECFEPTFRKLAESKD